MIFTDSAFIYGHTVDDSNNTICFSEGGLELVAVLSPGSYTITEYADEVARALNETGALDYLTTIDRANRLITISASGNFTLKVASGSSNDVSAFPMIGFTGSDRTGDDSYEGNVASGLEYKPQFQLQSFIHADDDQELNQSSVNESASSETVETISYGLKNWFSFNIMMANDYPQLEGGPFREDLSGVANLRAFLSYITKKRQIEFIPDIEDYDSYFTVLIESTSKSSKGTGFFLKELYADGLVGYYESGTLKFRKLS